VSLSSDYPPRLTLRVGAIVLREQRVQRKSITTSRLMCRASSSPASSVSWKALPFNARLPGLSRQRRTAPWKTPLAKQIQRAVHGSLAVMGLIHRWMVGEVTEDRASRSASTD